MDADVSLEHLEHRAPERGDVGAASIVEGDHSPAGGAGAELLGEDRELGGELAPPGEWATAEVSGVSAELECEVPEVSGGGGGGVRGDFR